MVIITVSITQHLVRPDATSLKSSWQVGRRSNEGEVREGKGWVQKEGRWGKGWSWGEVESVFNQSESGDYLGVLPRVNSAMEIVKWHFVRKTWGGRLGCKPVAWQLWLSEPPWCLIILWSLFKYSFLSAQNRATVCVCIWVNFRLQSSCCTVMIYTTSVTQPTPNVMSVLREIEWFVSTQRIKETRAERSKSFPAVLRPANNGLSKHPYLWKPALCVYPYSHLSLLKVSHLFSFLRALMSSTDEEIHPTALQYGFCIFSMLFFSDSRSGIRYSFRACLMHLYVLSQSIWHMVNLTSLCWNATKIPCSTCMMWCNSDKSAHWGFVCGATFQTFYKTILNMSGLIWGFCSCGICYEALTSEWVLPLQVPTLCFLKHAKV